MLFYEAVEYFKLCDVEEKVDRAEYIFNFFLTANATLELNVNQTAKDKVKPMLQSPTNTMFDELIGQTKINIMDTFRYAKSLIISTCSRFQMTPVYKKVQLELQGEQMTPFL